MLISSINMRARKSLKKISTPANSIENLSDVSSSPKTPVTAVINHMRHPAQKRLDKTLVLVDVSGRQSSLLADLIYLKKV